MNNEPYRISRIFKAPREIVFLAHTDVAHLAAWMGPAGTKILKSEMDFRVGGTYHYGYTDPTGAETWGKQVFQEIVVPEKIVLLQSFSNPKGDLVRHPMAATWPLEMLATLTFREVSAGETELTVSWLPYNAGEAEHRMFDNARAGMDQGFAGTFAKLDDYLLATGDTLTVSRLVNAPRERVYRAFTDPAQVNQFWGPDGFTNIDVKQDVRVGGEWSFTMVGPDGTKYPNHSTYVELVEPERIVYDHGNGKTVVFRQTILLVAVGQKTLVSFNLKAKDRTARDKFLGVGAIPGGQQNLSKLDAWVQGHP